MRNKLRIAEEQQQLETFMKLREQPVSSKQMGEEGMQQRPCILCGLQCTNVQVQAEYMAWEEQAPMGAACEKCL
jgi:hypothetical protein